MSSIQAINLLSYLEVVLCAIALAAITWKKQWPEYRSLGAFLVARFVADSILIPLYHATQIHSRAHVAYVAYFNVYWVSFVIESILSLAIIYSVFQLAMAPLKGLQTLGMLVFRWAAAISTAVALGSAFAPNISSKNYIIAAMSQLLRTQSILILCLLLFVCFAIRPMGLNYGSRIFGVSLGLGLMATTDLVQSAWLPHNQSMHTAYDLINGGAICVMLTIWTAYFALPEPKRRMIVLPTTSPFLRWNQIAQALGDSPGFVAVGGIPPELFSSAEVEVMRRASLKMVTQFPKSVGA